MAKPYPFRFYGARPAHGFDDHLFYEVLFVKPPTAAQKAALASTLENSSAGTSVELTETLWSGRWAHPRHYRYFQASSPTSWFTRALEVWPR